MNGEKEYGKKEHGAGERCRNIGSTVRELYFAAERQAVTETRAVTETPVEEFGE